MSTFRRSARRIIRAYYPIESLWRARRKVNEVPLLPNECGHAVEILPACVAQAVLELHTVTLAGENRPSEPAAWSGWSPGEDRHLEHRDRARRVQQDREHVAGVVKIQIGRAHV